MRARELLLACLAVAAPARAQVPPSGTLERRAAPAAATLEVRDARTSQRLVDVAITIDGAIVALTDREGIARITLTRGSATIDVERIGYSAWRGIIAAAAAGAPPRVIELEPAPVALRSVRVESRALGAGEAMQPATIVGAAQLAERMAPSVALMIATEPGVTARTNGPMAAQPVIRGLGGDRVLVLEDGLRTGDISTTAPDHSIAVEPATARRIEIIRGPAGLLYGSNTLGGVVNVVREDVPRSLVRPGGLLSLHAESVNRGIGGAARAHGSLGPVAWQLDGAARSAGDTRTPRGVPLPNTDLQALDAGAGAAFVTRDVRAGIAVREYRSRYGVPSSYGGVTLPGSHDGGVYIDVQRSTARVETEWRPASGAIDGVFVAGNAVRYDHSEYEDGGFVGTRFGQLAWSGEAIVRLRSPRHSAAFGVAGQWRDLRAEGSFTGTRPAVQKSAALFAVNDLTLGRATLLTGVRVDGIRTVPLDSTETLLLRDVRSRDFIAVTGALGVRMPFGAGWSATLHLARAFRPPAIEELYSAGPHLASYAYEIGSPRLEAERGVGLDAVLRWQQEHVSAELAAYVMRMEGFIAFAPQIDSTTGLPLRDPRLRRYVVYRPEQSTAQLVGAEARVTVQPAVGWLLDVSADLPRGSRDDGSPLPAMPSATTRLEVRRISAAWSAAVHLDRRWARDRVPAAPSGDDVTCEVVVRDGEATALPADFCPAPAALLVGGAASIRLPALHRAWPVTAALSIDNLFDTRWRDPLWRAGLVAPQPGRNIRLTLQVSP